MPSGASSGPSLWIQTAMMAAPSAQTPAATRRCKAPRTSPRFQPMNGPTAISSSSGKASTPKVAM